MTDAAKSWTITRVNRVIARNLKLSTAKGNMIRIVPTTTPQHWNIVDAINGFVYLRAVQKSSLVTELTRADARELEPTVYALNGNGNARCVFEAYDFQTACLVAHELGQGLSVRREDAKSDETMPPLFPGMFENWFFKRFDIAASTALERIRLNGTFNTVLATVVVCDAEIRAAHIKLLNSNAGKHQEWRAGITTHRLVEGTAMQKAIRLLESRRNQ